MFTFLVTPSGVYIATVASVAQNLLSDFASILCQITSNNSGFFVDMVLNIGVFSMNFRKNVLDLLTRKIAPNSNAA